MCMKNLILTKKDLTAANQNFADGYLRNEPSLDYALEYQKHNIAWTKKLAHLIRAILIDHIFEEGNKRTACAILLDYVNYYEYEINEKTALMLIKNIILKNITSIKRIKEMIEDGISKKN